jgi:tetratricopeptide (TPR) repeat protein
MARNAVNDRVNDLFQKDRWIAARKLLEKELAKDPENHWLLTQIGVTLYEQRRYQQALRLFQRSRKILDDCPLTLWNLAGTLDALGKPAEAARIFTRLLNSKVSPEEDPCWESKAWTQALKTDCLYRLGVCYQHLGKKRKAEHYLREYIDLLLMGVNGSYSLDDVEGHLRALRGPVNRSAVDRKFMKLGKPVLHAGGGVSRLNGASHA